MNRENEQAQGSELSDGLGADDMAKLANLLNFCANELPIEFRKEAEDARHLESILRMKWGRATERTMRYFYRPTSAGGQWENITADDMKQLVRLTYRDSNNFIRMIENEEPLNCSVMVNGVGGQVKSRPSA